MGLYALIQIGSLTLFNLLSTINIGCDYALTPTAHMTYVDPLPKSGDVVESVDGSIIVDVDNDEEFDWLPEKWLKTVN
jgi:hypothetical protein